MVFAYQILIMQVEGLYIVKVEGKTVLVTGPEGP
jgi:hypothetical protein